MMEILIDPIIGTENFSVQINCHLCQETFLMNDAFATIPDAAEGAQFFLQYHIPLHASFNGSGGDPTSSPES